MIKLNLTIDELNGVLASLGKMPYEFSYPLIEKIKKQAIPQVQPALEEKLKEEPVAE